MNKSLFSWPIPARPPPPFPPRNLILQTNIFTKSLGKFSRENPIMMARRPGRQCGGGGGVADAEVEFLKPNKELIHGFYACPCVDLARAFSVLAFLAAARRSSASFTESVRSLGLPKITAHMLTSKTSLPLPGLSRVSAFPRGKCLASDAGTVGVS